MVHTPFEFLTNTCVNIIQTKTTLLKLKMALSFYRNVFNIERFLLDNVTQKGCKCFKISRKILTQANLF